MKLDLPLDFAYHNNDYYVITMDQIMKVSLEGTKLRSIPGETLGKNLQLDRIYLLGGVIIIAATDLQSGDEQAYCLSQELHVIGKCKDPIQKLIKNNALDDAHNSYYVWEDKAFFLLTGAETNKVLGKMKSQLVTFPNNIHNPAVSVRFTKTYIYGMGSTDVGFYIQRMPFK